MATQRDVAKLANVSFITVSRVINNKGNVKHETRKRVEAAIKELNYYPNSIAQGLNSNKLKTLAVQVALPTNTSVEGTSYFRRILIGIERYSIKKGYDILLTSQRGSRENLDFLKSYYERKADGILSIGSKPPVNQLKKIVSENIPYIIIGDRDDELPINFVDTENRTGMLKATEYLISKGHRDIGYILGYPITHNTQERFDGFKIALENNNIKLNTKFLFHGDYSTESGAEALNYFMNLVKKPTAIISSTDLMAIGVNEEALSKNIKIPDEVSLIGFDGHEICSYTNPPIATMRQPLEEMGEEAAKIIIEQIDSNISEPKHVVFPVILDKGESIKSI